MRLTAADASFIYGESASSPMHISSVYVLDGELDFRALMNRFEKRIHQVPLIAESSSRSLSALRTRSGSTTRNSTSTTT